MKKNIFLLTLLFSGLIACNSRALNLQNNDYTIVKIDSINNYYLIYAKKKDTMFKIVSKKETLKNIDRIKINNTYQLTLYSRKSEAPVINGVKIYPVNIIDVMCHNYEDDTQICTDRKNGIYDLYSTSDLKGLYYVK